MDIEEKKIRARIANRKYYESHKQEEKDRTKQYRKDNLEKYKMWVEKNKNKIRSNSRRYEYNLLPEEFDFKLKDQNGKCALCFKVFENYDVDHDHSCCSHRKTCGKCNRGLLCHGCNTALGLFGESEEVLQRTIDYLKKWKGLQCPIT